MMLALGMFVFELRTLPYQSMQHSKDYRWASNDRVGKPPAYQFLGEGETAIQLAGTLYPAITGGHISLLAVELMADEGRAWPLIEGTGKILGMYIIDKVSTTHAEFFSDGAARKIDFTLSLKRVDESLTAMFGDLNKQASELLGSAGNLTDKFAGCARRADHMITGMTIDAGASLAPAFMLTLNSQDITSNFSDRLISLTMTDNRGFEADQLDIELDDTDGKVELPLRGAVLTLWLGWQGSALLNKGDFTVDEIEHRGAPDTLTIRARSADFRGTLNSRREESWHDTTIGELVSTIAKRNKLTASVADSLKQIPVPHIDQSQESDAVFLTRLADRNGATVSVKAGKLLFLKAGSALTASGKPIPQMTLTRSDGDRHQFAIADRGAYTGVTAKWLHTKDPKPQKQKVTLKRQPKEKHLRALEHPKAKPVSKKTKSRKEPEAREGEYMAGEADNVLALTTVYASKAQAMRAAQAKWDKLQRGVAEFQLRWRLVGLIYSLRHRCACQALSAS
ncbi:phage late control gene D [Salmonella enterica subsp. enterica]|nr:phage late control gene D [Salmonella enterica subsp. enterica]